MSEESIATKLRQAREQQGKTHEQIHRQLGLSLNVLQAVESGNFKVVEPIYIRMILKTYGDHLGLDGDAILKQYNDQFGAPPPPLEVPPQPTPGPHPQVALGDDLDLPADPGTSPHWQPSPLPVGAFSEPKPAKSRGGLLVLGGGALLLVLLVALYLADNRGEEPRATLPERAAPQARPPAGPRPELAPQRPAQAAPETAQPQAAAAAPGSAPDTTAPPMPAAMTDPQLPKTAEMPPPATAGASPAVPPPAPAAAAAQTAPTPGGLVLEVEAVEPTWVQVRWDERGLFETVLQPGSTRRLEAKKQFLIWAGNGRGLRYRFQGQPVAQGVLGDPNRTVRFRASKEGVAAIDREVFERLSARPDSTARVRPDSAR